MDTPGRSYAVDRPRYGGRASLIRQRSGKRRVDSSPDSNLAAMPLASESRPVNIEQTTELSSCSLAHSVSSGPVRGHGG